MRGNEGGAAHAHDFRCSSERATRHAEKAKQPTKAPTRAGAGRKADHDGDGEGREHEDGGLRGREGDGEIVPGEEIVLEVLHAEARRVVVERVVPHHHRAYDSPSHLRAPTVPTLPSRHLRFSPPSLPCSPSSSLPATSTFPLPRRRLRGWALLAVAVEGSMAPWACLPWTRHAP